MIAVSIVSHLHGHLVVDLLRDLAALRRDDLRVILTLNAPEEAPADQGIPVEIIRNATRMGFGANHNQALKHSLEEFYCILNPDVRLPQDPFPALLEALQPQEAALAAPFVQSPLGLVENNARRFPTVSSLAAKGLGLAPQHDYADKQAPFSPDWVAGMFMLAKRTAFEAVGGFDERYFLYYEDVDLCRRLRLRGYDVRLVPGARIIHDARRTSHRNLKFLAWHLSSILRYLTTRYR